MSGINRPTGLNTDLFHRPTLDQRKQIDDRGFFVLPQKPEDAGYYTYGTPKDGQGQFANPRMLSFIFKLELEWSKTESRKIGLGNISLADGARFPPHHSHKSGLEVDIRPIRKDGLAKPVSYLDDAYDRDATAKLVAIALETGMVNKVFFNDLKIKSVFKLAGHNDHLHISVK